MKKGLFLFVMTFWLVPALDAETVYVGKNKEGLAAVTTSVQDMFVGRQIDTFAPVQIKPEPVTQFGKFVQKVIRKEIPYRQGDVAIAFALSCRRPMKF